jgi:hypothetical protein
MQFILNDDDIKHLNNVIGSLMIKQFKGNQEETDGDETKSTIQKTEDFLNKINQSGLNVSTSGIGIEKKFGDEEKGFNAKIFGNQPFGGQFNYGGQVGFNMKF